MEQAGLESAPIDAAPGVRVRVEQVLSPSDQAESHHQAGGRGARDRGRARRRAGPSSIGGENPTPEPRQEHPQPYEDQNLRDQRQPAVPNQLQKKRKCRGNHDRVHQEGGGRRPAGVLAVGKTEAERASQMPGHHGRGGRQRENRGRRRQSHRGAQVEKRVRMTALRDDQEQKSRENAGER